MSTSVYDLKQFYSRRAGRLVRRLVSSHINDLWPGLDGQRVLGYGYATPYLRPIQEQAERVFAAMPAQNGVHFWPEGQKGLVCLTAENELPFETESIDRILVVHGLEFAESPETMFNEFWRVLKGNGRLLLVVPSRLGMWARVDRTPFGHGTPYTLGQINGYLQRSLFTMEQKERALFMPPFRSFLVLRTAYTFESFGRFIFPGLAGLHLIEASKQIYAASPKGKAEKVRGRKIIVGEAVPT
ncbi:MAG: methyltransferase domain-containing protein [Rhodospirillales bacterium]|nr:methyltransferase domain-containing protein [Rhodospirillales bacterium]MCB9995886.1 methyltransferase domain-containing protein [Rhodospirillales bacterium]